MSVFWPKKNRFFFDFLASPGGPGGSQTKNSENYIFTMKKIDFYGKMGRNKEYGIRNTEYGTRPQEQPMEGGTTVN